MSELSFKKTIYSGFMDGLSAGQKVTDQIKQNAVANLHHLYQSQEHYEVIIQDMKQLRYYSWVYGHTVGLLFNHAEEILVEDTLYRGLKKAFKYKNLSFLDDIRNESLSDILRLRKKSSESLENIIEQRLYKLIHT